VTVVPPGGADSASPTPAEIHDRFNSRAQARARFVAQRGILKPVVSRLVTPTVIGLDNLRSINGGYVVVANHSSHMDTPLIFTSLPKRLARYLAAGAAADYFFDVWWRRGLTALFFNAFPVHRSAANAKVVSAKGLLRRGIPLLVFPEGTRSKDGTLGGFKPGAAALATSCKVPVVPVGLIGVNIAHPRGTNWPKRGRLPVGVVFGKPMLAREGENPVEFTERVKREIIRLREEFTPSILGPAITSKGAQP
jgi:1-acyl-sn-glycerol-3-phosphate acyltransferase